MAKRTLSDREYLNRYSMTVAEYIEHLKKLPLDARVVKAHYDKDFHLDFARKPNIAYLKIEDIYGVSKRLLEWFPEPREENESESIFQIVKL